MYTENEIFSKVDQLLSKIHQTRNLQKLALENGINVKNSVIFTDAAEENYAVSVIALMLAKDANDPKYHDLVRNGMEHRASRIDVINEYKDQANQLMTKYKNRNKMNMCGSSYGESAVYTEARHRDSNVYALIGSAVFPSFGSILGYEIGKSTWRDNATKELAGFIKDLAKAITENNGFKIAKRMQRVSQACDVCMNVSNRYTKEEIELIRDLKGDTIALKQIDESTWKYIVNNYIFSHDLAERGALPVTGHVKPARKAVEAWSETANKVLEVFSNKDKQSLTESALYTEAHHRKTGKGMLIGSIIPGLGTLIGYEIGRASWRNHAAEELVRFIDDLAEAIDSGNGFKIAKRIQRVSQACDICMNESKDFSSEDMKLIKQLKADTINLKQINEDTLTYIVNQYVFGHDVTEKGALPVTGYVKPAMKAIEMWTETANKVLGKLKK